MKIEVCTLDEIDLKQWQNLIIHHDVMTMPNVQIPYDQALSFWREWRDFWERVQDKYELDKDSILEINYYSGTVTMLDDE